MDVAKSRIRFLITAILMVVVGACTSPKNIVLNGEFIPSDRNPADVLRELRGLETPIEGISGRARAQYSGPGSSERSGVIFTSDRDRTLMVFRNNLGIEGGSLLVEPDSVTFYNRIDQFAQRVSNADHDVLFENGFYAVNLLQILNPDLQKRTPRRVFESETAWRITFDDQVSMVFDKETGDLLQYDLYILNNFAFSTYLFGNHMEVAGYRLPRNIQITTKDKRSNIYLSVQSIDVNPAFLDMTLNIPSHVRIERP
ncbi:MAG TPA: hypothetical protein DCE78_01435 [Bacteroidetes bacterium]|nr:hypothetical protein [Bacteroidota bacterium]